VPTRTTATTRSRTTTSDLVAAGYLTAFVPERLGGAGLTLEEVAREQVRLAGAAPATALAANMHLVVTGLAALLVARGDASVEFVLRDAAAGEVFAFGSSEAGNDLVVFGARTRAVLQPDGGYRYHGTKIIHVAVAGLDPAGDVRPRRLRPRRPAPRARRRGTAGRGCAGARRLGHPRHAGHAVGDHGPRRCVRAGGPRVPAAAAGPVGRPVRARAVRGLRDAARGCVHGHRPPRARAGCRARAAPHVDVLAGIYHPSDDESAHATLATSVLGPPEQ